MVDSEDSDQVTPADPRECLKSLPMAFGKKHVKKTYQRTIYTALTSVPDPLQFTDSAGALTGVSKSSENSQVASSAAVPLQPVPATFTVKGICLGYVCLALHSVQYSVGVLS